MFNLINDENALRLHDLPTNANLFNLSTLRQFEESFHFRSFSIKYVIEGCENYIVNGNRYQVAKGEYLLANALCEGHLAIDSKEPVIGLCIDIEPQIISEVAALQMRPDTAFPDIGLALFFHTDSFLDNKYQVGGTALGSTLSEIGLRSLSTDSRPEILSKELFYRLAEDIVRDHLGLFRQINDMDKVKASTRKDLYRRVLKGRSFLDAHFTENISMEAVAKEAAISEYYFYRLFKKIYHTTPYNYLLNKRLEMASRLIGQHKMNITDVAYCCGFSSIHTFSKMFKKKYGRPPSHLML